VPPFVKDEFDAFLECGILAHRFAEHERRRPIRRPDWLVPTWRVISISV
jgi:hypothetical protein